MKKQKKIDFRIVIAAIGGITIMECVALINGIDGILLTSVVAVLAALAGLSLPQLKLK